MIDLSLDVSQSLFGCVTSRAKMRLCVLFASLGAAECGFLGNPDMWSSEQVVDDASVLVTADPSEGAGRGCRGNVGA